jgi:hypothetical protein
MAISERGRLSIFSNKSKESTGLSIILGGSQILSFHWCLNIRSRDDKFRHSRVFLLVLSNSEKVLFMLRQNFSFFYKITYLNEEANCTEPSLSLKAPCL